METPTRSATEDTVAEHLPWAHLTVPPRPRPGRVSLAIAAAVGLAALGIIIGRAATVPAEPPVPPTTAALPTTTAEPVRNAIVAGPTPTAPLREADLRSSPATVPAALAMARAEWFLVEYLTRLGDPDQLERVVAAGGWEAPPLGAAGNPVSAEVLADLEVGASYVEWVGALEVDMVATDRFLVGAVVGRLAAPARGEQFTRLPLEGWQVEVTVDVHGASAVTAWPAPIDIPSGASADPPAEPHGSFVDGAGLGFPVGEPQAP